MHVVCWAPANYKQSSMNYVLLKKPVTTYLFSAPAEYRYFSRFFFICLSHFRWTTYVASAAHSYYSRCKKPVDNEIAHMFAENFRRVKDERTKRNSSFFTSRIIFFALICAYYFVISSANWCCLNVLVLRLLRTVDLFVSSSALPNGRTTHAVIGSELYCGGIAIRHSVRSRCL